MESVVAKTQDADMRLDVFVSEQFDITRSAAQKLLEDGNVFVNGDTVTKKYKIKAGDEVRVKSPNLVLSMLVRKTSP